MTDRDALLALVPGGVLVLDAVGHVVHHNAAAEALLGRAIPAGAPAAELLGGAPRPGRLALPGGPTVRVRTAALAGGHTAVALLPDEAAPGRTDRFVSTLLEGVRGPLGGIRAAIETLTQYPGMEPAVAAHLQALVQEQALALSRLVEDAAEAYARQAQARWPLRVVPAHEVLADAVEAARRLDGVAVTSGADGEPLPIRADREVLAAALGTLAELVENAVRPERLALRLRRSGRFAGLEIGWSGAPVRPERLGRWREHAVAGLPPARALTLGEVLDHHGADLQSRAEEGNAWLCLLLPLAEGA